MPGETNCPCKSYPATPTFIVDTTTFQNAANTVYLAKLAYDRNPANIARNKVMQFKSDYERMQYLLGRYGRRCGSS
jgi:hypothetical protein